MMPPKNWVASNTNWSKRRRLAPAGSLPRSTNRNIESTHIHNRDSVQSQVANQTVHGGQFYGSVSIHNNAITDNSDEELTALKENLLASLAFPGMLDRRDNISQPHGDTCKWILDLQQYRDWEEASRGLLWVKGKPGSGKSTLMSFLHRRFRRESDSESEIHLDFFFHARGSELQHSRLGMIRSLLNQLLRQCPEIGSQVLDSYREKCAAYGSAAHSWEWQLPKLEQIFLDAVIESAAHHRVTVFVDALDEAGTEHARAVAKYLHKINDEAARPQSGNIFLQLKICISSRHYPVEPIAQSIEICMEDHNTNDIEDFVRHEIDQVILAVDRPFIQSHWTQLTADILAHANGVFQWVRLVLQLVIEEFEHGWLIEDTSSFFKTIPKDLTDIYAYILQSIMSRNRTRESLLLFQWVCQAVEPLTPQELMCALDSVSAISTTRTLYLDLDEQSMKRCIRSLSGGLVEVVYVTSGQNLGRVRSGPNTMIVQVIHQTVNEYIMTQGLVMLSKCSQGGDACLKPTIEDDQVTLIHQCHSNLYWCCLEYLESLDYHFATNLRREMYAEAPAERSPKFAESLSKTYPFAKYATMYIFEHAQKASYHRSTNKALLGESHHELIRLKHIRPLWILIFEFVNDNMLDRNHGSDSLLHIVAYYNVADLVQYLLDCGEPFDQENARGETPLHTASRRGHLEVCEILSSVGADINAVTTGHVSALALAASGGHSGLASWMLESGADVDPSADEDLRPLCGAVVSKSVSVIRLLLDAGADVDVRGHHRDPALQIAARAGQFDISKLLIDAGADVNFEGGQYGTALQAAACSESLKLVELLVHAGADVNIEGGKYGTALQAAACHRNLDIAKLLIDAGADMNVEGSDYGTALQAAACYGALDIVKLLVDAGADVNIKGGRYGTALQAAARCGKSDIVELLVAAGADVNIKGDDLNTALNEAALHGNLNAVKRLIDAGANVNMKGDYYGAPLQAAARSGNSDIVKLLIDVGADMNNANTSSDSGIALQVAACREELDIVKLLVDAWADVNIKNHEKGTALRAVARRGNFDIAKLLIEAGADVNLKSHKNGTALLAAVRCGNLNIVKLLIDAGADVNAKNGCNGTALEAAERNGHTEVSKLLLDAGAI